MRDLQIYSTKIIPIILSGGAGSRLWPVSRRMHPKPFMEVAGKPLLTHALERAALISDEAIIVTNQDHYFLTENLLENTPKATKSMNLGFSEKLITFL